MNPVVFKTNHKANFHEIDPFGHVNSVHFLKYYLDHRFTAIRELLGIGLSKLFKLPFKFVISNININYMKPLYLDMEFIIESKLIEVNKKNCVVFCQMINPNNSNEILSTCKFELVCMDKITERSIDWPHEFISVFFENNNLTIPYKEHA